MTDDQFWRIVIVAGFFAIVGLFRPQISRFMHRIGYRDWREKPPDKKTTDTETRS